MRISSLARSVAVFGTTTVTGTPNLRRASVTAKPALPPEDENHRQLTRLGPGLRCRGAKRAKPLGA